MANEMNIKNQIDPGNLLALQMKSSPQTSECKSSMIDPPVIMNITHVPPDRYIVGNMAQNFPSFGPDIIIHFLVIYNGNVSEISLKKDFISRFLASIKLNFYFFCDTVQFFYYFRSKYSLCT